LLQQVMGRKHQQNSRGLGKQKAREGVLMVKNQIDHQARTVDGLGGGILRGKGNEIVHGILRKNPALYESVERKETQGGNF